MGYCSSAEVSVRVSALRADSLQSPGNLVFGPFHRYRCIANDVKRRGRGRNKSAGIEAQTSEVQNFLSYFCLRPNLIGDLSSRIHGRRNCSLKTDIFPRSETLSANRFLQLVIRKPVLSPATLFIHLDPPRTGNFKKQDRHVRQVSHSSVND